MNTNSEIFMECRHLLT